MRITSVNMTMESRVNYGDFQGAMAQIALSADLDGETPEEAFKQLRATAQQQIVYCIKSGSPHTIRNLIGGKKDEADADEGKTEEPAKRKRRTKAEMEADAKKAKEAKKPKDDDDLDGELEDDDLNDPADGNSIDDDDDDFGAEPEEITRQTVTKALRDLKSEKGSAAVTKAIKSVGAARFAEVANDQLETLYKNVNKLLNA